MKSSLPPTLVKLQYAKEAEAYLAYLRTEHPEHFMEATSQAQQRKITLESLDLIEVRRPDFHLFNELLVQYRLKKDGAIQKVVPDNMVVLWADKIKAVGSYDVEFQPARPFWVLEYVSKGTKRKDYETNFQKYEQELKVPYYLIFYPDDQELSLYRRNRSRYVSVKPNKEGRYAIPELEIEVAILDEWVRFWFRGELVPLSPELQREVDELRQQLRDEMQRADEATRRADNEARRADEEARRADEAMRRADEQQRKAEEALRELANLRADLARRKP